MECVSWRSFSRCSRSVFQGGQRQTEARASTASLMTCRARGGNVGDIGVSDTRCSLHGNCGVRHGRGHSRNRGGWVGIPAHTATLNPPQRLGRERLLSARQAGQAHHAIHNVCRLLRGARGVFEGFVLQKVWCSPWPRASQRRDADGWHRHRTLPRSVCTGTPAARK